jgi:hypothetical protein
MMISPNENRFHLCGLYHENVLVSSLHEDKRDFHSVMWIAKTSS